MRIKVLKINIKEKTYKKIMEIEKKIHSPDRTTKRIDFKPKGIIYKRKQRYNSIIETLKKSKGKNKSPTNQGQVPKAKEVNLTILALTKMK